MDPWLIVDPRFADPAERAVAQAVMTMVTSNWQELPELNVADPVVQGVLRRHRIATLVPTDAVPESARQQFREELQSAYVTQMRLQAAAIEVCTALTDAGIEHRVLKGLASAFLDYPRPELRQTGDVDLIVDRVDLDRADDVLKSLGCKGRSAGRAPQLAKGRTLNTEQGVEIDVHTRIFRRSEIGIDLLGFGSEAVPAIASEAMPLELRLIHAAGHFVLTPPGARRLSGMADVSVILNESEPDWDAVVSLAKQLNAAPMIGATLSLEAQLSRRRTGVRQEGWGRVSPLDRRVLLAPHRRPLAEHIMRFGEVPRSERLSYLPVWLTPQRATLKKTLAEARAQRRG